MVFKRARSAYWHYRFMREGVTVYVNTKQRNKTTAEELESAHRTRLAKGEAGLVTGAVPTLKQFQDRFMKAIKVRCAEKPRTIEYYQGMLKRLVEYAPLAGVRLDRIDEALIEQFVQHCTGKTAVATINRRLATLRRALRLAQEWKIISRVPRIRLLPGEKQREFVLSRQLEALYLDACGYPLREMATLILDTGLRRNEAVGLLWQHVHLDKGYFQVVAGKSVNAKRTIPLTARAAALLQGLPRIDDYVFTSGTGPYYPTHPDHLHEDVRERLELSSEFVLHSLRHTFGTRLGESGADAFTIMKLMGHSSITVSQRYVHPSTDAMQRAISGMELGIVRAQAVESKVENTANSM